MPNQSRMKNIRKQHTKPWHIRLRLMQLAEAALSDLLQNLRVGTGLTQLNTDRPRHPVEQPYDRAASHQ